MYALVTLSSVRQIVRQRYCLNLRTVRNLYHNKFSSQRLLNAEESKALRFNELSTNQQNLCKLHSNSGFINASICKKKFSTSSSTLASEKEQDDLQRILKDKTLGFTAKFKILFRQYGIVLMSVHIVTAIGWLAIFYYAIKNFDVITYLEKIGVFRFLERIGFSYADKLKKSSASDWLMTYLLYEIAKPVRYLVTLFGTVYSVRYLRKIGYFKPPPKAATMGELVQRQSNIMQHRFQSTTTKYRQQYGYRNKKNFRNYRNGTTTPENKNTKK